MQSQNKTKQGQDFKASKLRSEKTAIEKKTLLLYLNGALASK